MLQDDVTQRRKGDGFILITDPPDVALTQSRYDVIIL